MVYEVSFGEWLSRRRKSLGLTQVALAEKINCAVITLRKIEAEQRRPSLQIAGRIAQVLCVPSSEQKSFLRFARGEWLSTPPVEMVHIPWRTTGTAPWSRPIVPHTSFVGRSKEISELSQIVVKPAVRLVTIVGAPGVGKSRLADELCRRMALHFPGGVFSISLATHADTAEIESALLQAIKSDQNLQGSLPQSLANEIASKRILLVLDDLEHIIQNARQVVYHLIQSYPNIKILAASRAPLHVAGELLFRLSPLDLPDEYQVHSLDLEVLSRVASLELFSACARVFQPGFNINPENVKEVVAICEQLDGLPLAIELVAPRLRLLSPQSLLVHLSSQFVLQSSAPDYLPENHATLQKAVDRSYALLTVDEKRLFTYLSIFPGSFTLGMVEAAFSATPPHNVIADLVVSLLDKSLVHQLTSAQKEPQFTLLKVIRLYAAEHLKDFNQDAVASWQIPTFLSPVGKHDGKLGSTPRQTFDADRATVGFHKGLGNRKTQPHPV